MIDFAFYLGLSLLVMHEMDAIRCHEWRIFPGLSLLNDWWGYPIFLLAHIPLFSWIFMQLTHPTATASFRNGMDVFMIVHLGLHVLFLWHPKNEFKDAISWVIIAGAAVAGFTDLIL